MGDRGPLIRYQLIWKSGHGGYVREPDASVHRLRDLLEDATLRLIEARNPGIDIVEVQEQRARDCQSWRAVGGPMGRESLDV